MKRTTVARSFAQYLFLSLAVLWLLASGCQAPSGASSSTPSASSLEPKALQEELLQSAMEGDLARVTESLKRGAQVNGLDADKRSALMLAGFEGRTEVARYLLENGAQVNLADINGRTALMFASSGPFPETVALFLEKGADVNASDKHEGWTALMFAAGEGQLEVCQALLRGGADKTLKDKDGDQAIDHAGNSNQVKVVELLK